ncbi:hypothetical protein JVT61DRAFT_14129 [Boletus reticuloceps]|uniref:Uncharacterized protein n=1 Tax=Boletus reticuloceps TaxID=495285 RepID=A0A8I2YD96_9AGAM|nr:hypothetical protein JVT61DRAFT_14129 [Boletus reticuloceps]
MLMSTTNAVMFPKYGHILPTMTVSSKPFVVSSVSTQRYAPSKKTPAQKLPPVLPPTSTPQWVPTKQTCRPGSFVVPKVERRRPSPNPVLIPAPNMTTRVQKSPPLSPVSSAYRSFPEKTFVPRRRSYVPRSRIYQPSVDVSVRAPTGPRNPVISRQQPSVSMAKSTERIKDTDIYAKKPLVIGECRAGIPTKNPWRTAPKPIAYPPVTWSPPPSPDLSSFRSQSWKIVVNGDVKRTETPSTMSDASSITGTPSGSCWTSRSVSPSPTLSSSSTVIGSLESLAKLGIGSDCVSRISSPTKGLSAVVSHTTCAATIITPSRNTTASSIATLAKVMDSRTPSPTRISQTGNRTHTTARYVVEFARTFFSTPQPRRSNLYSYQGGYVITSFYPIDFPTQSRTSPTFQNTSCLFDLIAITP